MSKKCSGCNCSGECSKPKRGRGRPRKEESAVAVAPKRKRGRPKKEESVIMVEEVVLNEDGISRRVTRDSIRATASTFRQHKKLCEALAGDLRDAFASYKDGQFAKKFEKLYGPVVRALNEFNSAIRETGVR